jgi:ferredoxin-NADP reductase
LIGAGSGLVPLMAMIRQRGALSPAVPTALLLSARTAADVLFSEELHSIEISDAAFVLALAITREEPIRASDFARRIDGVMVQEILARLHRKPKQVFVCGSNGFVNIATEGALLAGLDASIIKTERYGG